MSNEPEDGAAAAAEPIDPEPSSRLSALWSVLANWRDWNLPVKLAAVTLVPIVFAIVLGTMQISDQVDRASSYRRVDRLVVVNEELRGLVGALQRERGTAAVLLAARAGDVATELADEQQAVDGARDRFLRAAGRVTLDHNIVAARYADALTWLDELAGVRQQVTGPLFDSANAITRYTGVIDALLRFDRTMAAEAIDPELASTASALYDLEAIREQVEFQRALIGIGIVRGGLVGPERAALEGSMARLGDRITDFYAIAGPGPSAEFDRRVTGTAVAARNNVVDAVITNRPGAPIPTTAPDWTAASDLTAKRVSEVAASLGTQLRDRSATLQDEASDGAGLAAVILLVALVVAIAVMFVVGRHLLSSLGTLRRGALDVAERALPDAVARIRDRGEEAASITLEPMPVRSMDEVGQVARAFDAVQRQALRLATEQAGLRAKYSSVFVNLSRRSQGLVQRQLHLLERLERDEEDPDQLATLFQLDHLATRMRRNNENLMVLSGSEVGRRAQRPATLADLLRASVSEIEQYQRVVLLPPPDVLIVGYAVGDLVRLVAELLDNATVFSAPDTQVTIASHSFEDGSVCIAVLDEGIGMSQEELDEANRKLADSGSIDVSTSRRMGLFVIGRLAGRHGIEIRLNGGTDTTGVRATVTVPADVVASPTPEPEPPPRRSVRSNGAAPGPLIPFSLNGLAESNGHKGATNGSKVNGSAAAAVESDIARRLDGEEPPGGQAPLPRRSPGGRLPGPDPTPSPSLPASPDDGLFTPTAPDDEGGWWSAAEAPVDRSALEETTPIFDEMVSAWFRAMTDDPPADPPADLPADSPAESAESTEDGPWQFAADSGFDTARAVSRAEPSEYTSSGLPRRSRGENLVPGSAGQAAASGPRHGREADDVRERLASYRHGVRRARDHRQGRADPPPETLPVTPRRKPEKVSDPAGTLDSGGPEAAISQGQPGKADPPAATAARPGQKADATRTARTTQAGQSARATRPAKSGQATRAAKSGQGTRDTKSGQAAQAAKSSQPGEAVRKAKLGQPAQPAPPGQAGHRGEAARPGHAAQPAQSGQVAQLGEAVQPVQPGQAARPGQAGQLGDAGRAGRPGQADQPGQAARAEQARQATRAARPAQSAPPARSTQTPQLAQPGQTAQPARPRQPAQPAHPAHPARPDENGSVTENGSVAENGLPANNESPANNSSVANKRSPTNHGSPAKHGSAAENGRVAENGAATENGSAADHNAETAQLDLSGAGWRFAADVGWRAASAVSTSTPVDFTSGGLPRRSRGERLVPGSVAAPNGAGPLRVDRAEELRGRLGSFQKGLSRGRRSLAERASANGSPEQQESE